MLNESRITTKAFPTLGTFVGLLTCVCPLVADQAGTLTEALPAVGALVGLFSGVSPLVLY